jgi:hypothetical protein
MADITITPRLEHVRTFPIPVSFDLLTTERRFQLAPADRALLLDINLSINTAPWRFADGGANTTQYPSAAEVHLDYQDSGRTQSIDLTSDILAKLRAAMDSVDQNALQAQFQNGMNDTLATLIPLGRSSPDYVSTAQAKAVAIAKTRPISQLLTSLGNRSSETMGGLLALSNFLYSYIAVTPISIGDILKQHSVNIQNIREVFVAIKHSTNTPPSGTVNVLLEVVYHNELIDEFDRLETQIKTRLLDIHKKLAPDGPIMTNVTLTNNNVAALTRQLNSFAQALSDQNLQIKSITSGHDAVVSSLKGRIDNLEQAVNQLKLPGPR